MAKEKIDSSIVPENVLEAQKVCPTQDSCYTCPLYFKRKCPSRIPWDLEAMEDEKEIR